MSLASLADREIIARERSSLETTLRPRVSGRVQDIAAKFKIPSVDLQSFTNEIMPIASEPPVQPSKGSNALDALVRYIPTEAITLYVAACSVLAALKDKVPAGTDVRVYWGFVILTPLLFLIIYLGKRRSAQLPPFPTVGQWPWWKLIAATISFGVWALAVPTAPYLRGEVGGVLAGFLATFVSTFLTLLEPIFEPSKNG